MEALCDEGKYITPMPEFWPRWWNGDWVYHYETRKWFGWMKATALLKKVVIVYMGLEFAPRTMIHMRTCATTPKVIERLHPWKVCNPTFELEVHLRSVQSFFFP